MKNLIQFLVVSAALGCGPAPASKTAESSEPGAPESKEGDSAGSNIESQRKRFVDGCVQKGQPPQFCECGFEQFKVVFKDSDLSKPIEPSDARFQKLRDLTVSNCSSKLDAAQIEQSFVQTCSDGDERRKTYCSCAWSSLSKTMTPAEFVSTDPESPAFMDAKKKMVVACKGKFPEEAAKADFMGGCVKESPEPACKCLWKKLRAAFTTEEIVAGTVDVQSAPGLAECK